MTGIAHEAFTAVIANPSETADARRRAEAGSRTLSLVDRWFADGWSGVSGDDAPRAAARDAIARIGDDATQRETAALLAVVDAIDRLRHPAPGALDALLYDYAVVLQDRSAFALAIDVLRMITAYPHWLADRGTAGVAIDCYDALLIDDAMLRLGGCYRVLGDHDHAVDAYVRVQERSAARGDVARALRARLGAAKIAAVRGNLPIAEWLFDAIVAELSVDLERTAPHDTRATRAFIDLRAEARQELANIVHARGYPARAIELVFASWREVSGGRERGRMLVDLAAYFRDLGALTAATDANLLAQRAQEPVTRWTATVNLLELAVDRNDETSFDRQHEALRSIALPPFLEAAKHLYLARGYMRFHHDRRRASDAIAAATAVAEAHQLNKLLHDIEAYAATLIEPQRPSTREHPEPEPAVDAGVAHVAEAVRAALVAATAP